MENHTSIVLSSKLPAIKDGDHEAFIEVYNVLHVKIFRFFLKRAGLYDTAKDLTQQCFIRLWQFRHTLSYDHLLEKQIFIIARSLLINHIRKETVQAKLKILHSQTFITQDTQPVNDGLLEKVEEVNAAIETLPPVRKRVLMLKAMHGCTNKEIAQQLEISVKTVEDHVTKAFRHIRQVVVLILLILSFPS